MLLARSDSQEIDNWPAIQNLQITESQRYDCIQWNYGRWDELRKSDFHDIVKISFNYIVIIYILLW